MIINMCAYVSDAVLSMIPPYIVDLTIFTAVNAPALSQLADRRRIMLLNGVMMDIYRNQRSEQAEKHIIPGWPGYILQTAKGLIDYMINCARGNPEWPGPLRGK